MSSEVSPNTSTDLDTVVESFKRNKVGLKGILTTPTTFKGGVLQTLNMKIRSDLKVEGWRMSMGLSLGNPLVKFLHHAAGGQCCCGQMKGGVWSLY